MSGMGSRFARTLGRPWMDVIKHFKSRCVYCGQQSRPLSLTKDHLLPRSRGGGTRRNLVPACPACNSEKGCRTPREYAEALERAGRTPNFLLPDFLWRVPDHG